MEATQNGHAHGRAVPPLAAYTFRNGIVAHLRPVSQFTQAHIEIAARRRFPPPTPPLATVDYGNGPQQEPNPGDPAYQQALSEYQAFISSKVMDGMIELGVEVEVDHEALNDLARVLDLLNVPLDEISDKVAYVKHCCMLDIAADAPPLAQALRAAGGPTEEAIREQVATFQGDVSGPGSVPLPPPVERDPL